MENETKNFVEKEGKTVGMAEAESENVEISATADAEQIEFEVSNSEEIEVADEAPRDAFGDDEKEITDYRAYVRETIERQLDKYEKTKLETCSPQKIFNDAFECNAYVMIADALLDDDVEEEIFEALVNEGDDILDNLYAEYVDSPDASIRCNEDTIAFIKKYCQSAYPEIMNRPSHDLTI